MSAASSWLGISLLMVPLLGVILLLVGGYGLGASGTDIRSNSRLASISVIACALFFASLCVVTGMHAAQKSPFWVYYPLLGHNGDSAAP